MTPTSTRTDPPPWLQAAVSRLLPPTYREPVLGDLHERFGERDARTRWFGYLGDVVTTVPHVLRSQMRRLVTRRSTCAAAGDLRSRAEQLQTRVWLRNASMLFSVVLLLVMLLLNTRSGWQFNDIVSLATTVNWIAAAWQSYSAYGSTLVPASLSLDELRLFHRRQLIRQIDLGWRAFVYWSVPALLLVLYALAGGVPGFRGRAVTLLGALALQNGAVAWARQQERSRNQRELERLNQEVAQA